jgi:ABC-type glycerol-3-phosphate transport system permease component
MSNSNGATNMKYDSVRAGAVGGGMMRTLSFIGLVCGTAIIVFPLLWMVLVSLLTPDRAQAATVSGDLTKLFPNDPQWNNFLDALSQMGSVRWKGFFDALANSIVVTTLVVTGTVLSSSLVGFALARIRFRGNNALFLLMLGTMMLPGQVTISKSRMGGHNSATGGAGVLWQRVLYLHVPSIHCASSRGLG